jgi:hypothetical protein
MTANGDAGEGILNRPKRRPDGPLMGWIKPHVRGGPGGQVTIIQHKPIIILTPIPGVYES